MRKMRLPVSAVVLAAILALAGCGRTSSENQPAASIGGPGGAASKANAAKSDFDLKHPQVIIETSLGSITLELDGEKSPKTVENFLSYVDAGAYDQTIVHQVYKNVALVAGGYDKSLGPVRAQIPIRNEAAESNLKNMRGTIAMNRQPDVIDSATSQFFINVADNPALDCRNRDPENPQGYGYCVFGRVTKGMEVVDRIADAPVHDTKEFDQTPVQAVVVKAIRRAQ